MLGEGTLTSGTSFLLTLELMFGKVFLGEVAVVGAASVVAVGGCCSVVVGAGCSTTGTNVSVVDAMMVY